MPVIDLSALHLEHGSHGSPEEGMCVMEAVAYVAGEKFSDHPACASPLITAFLISWNDALGDADRQLLVPLVPRIVGTRTTDADEAERLWMLTDWLAREFAPGWLRLVGYTSAAELLEQLAPIKGDEQARAAAPALDNAVRLSRAGANAAWNAARDAAGNAAWNAAWDAAWNAARNAAGNAAWDAARDAAGNAAWNAARDAARDAAWDAARDAAWNAARNAAWNAARDAARDAARNAARDALRPTVESLQRSAILLVERMIEVGAASDG